MRCCVALAASRAFEFHVLVSNEKGYEAARKAVARAHDAFMRNTESDIGDSKKEALWFKRFIEEKSNNSYDIELVRHDWTAAEVDRLYNVPFADLMFHAQTVHRRHFDPNHVEIASLLSIKSGGCSEDCAHCSQSARYETGLKATRLIDKADVVATAERAKAAGAARFCMAVAWRSPKDRDLDQVCEMVSAVKGLGMDTCLVCLELDAGIHSG